MNQPKTTDPIDAMKYALAALEYYDEGHVEPTTASAAIDTLRQALKQQPSAWVGLTDDEIYDLYNEPRSDSEMVAFAREVEAKLKEKNT